MIIWQPGQQINNGRFIIQGKPLGSGGFGITYKALEPSTGKLYAIKTLNQQMQLREDFAEQQVKFINEALTIKGFDHRHIVKVDKIIQEGELFGVVMEYIDGVTLFQYVQNKGQLAESEALLYIDQIGQALEHIHQKVDDKGKNFIHRDIKPSNILLRKNQQEAVLIDFGLTRSIATNMTNALTAGYAPIEQYDRTGNFGPHTDVYALAATLYYLLTADGLKKEGEVSPIPAHNRQYGKEPLPEPKHYNSRISQRVNDAILQGMELEPKNRTKTVLEFRENLGLVSIEQPQPKPPTPTQPDLNNTQPSPTTKKALTYTQPPPVKPKPSPPKPKSQPVTNLSRRRMLQVLVFAGVGLLATIKPVQTLPEFPIGQDYTKLKNYLAAGKWKEADKETARLMLRRKPEKERWLEIDNIPCEDLRTIDQLWVKYSDGKFGFSVQKRIYQSFGGDGRDYLKSKWKVFGDKVGWRQDEYGWISGWIGFVFGQPDKHEWLDYHDITFDKKASEGHLPAWVDIYRYKNDNREYNCLKGYWGLVEMCGTDDSYEDFSPDGYVNLKVEGSALFSRVETCKL